ncbi:PstS family phosphate ABC transporter substrate-binding protein [Roseateles saccharophilus]|uniref:Phosphate ABC transporter substrate-binding protein (PhoT family) n=1 Tax=Roseateles saccharophilus TaxID=304 RepID=A0A4R3UQ29_ROSSA|nr:substrate-binding domain-containing protein [Roseateles saccharophilus]MDG0834681.1 phosphate ABC transporter substrate-binding protein, PhoT family [Roseateles saccharophilus]TCU92663.1 phosphate ABC transporter substrate-binding protein (PhoT family) [Roseateles saccharophilus]
MKKTLALQAGLAAAILTLWGVPAQALKYAAPEHSLKADPSIPNWNPGPVASEPEEELPIVGADIMDEVVLGWAKIYRKQYPRLSLTLDLRASGAGGPGLVSGKGQLAPVGREMFPAERKAFVDKFGYEPLEIKVATGSVGSLGKTAASVILVDKDNPIDCLSLPQLDAIYSKTRKLGYREVNTWGDVGATGAWAAKPIHLYGLKPVNGIEQYFKAVAMDGGEYKDNIQFMKGKGFKHVFTVVAEEMATHPAGLTYALLANVTPNVKVLNLSTKQGGSCYAPTTENVYQHKYPFSRYVYIYVNKVPGKPLEPKVKEFLKLVLSQEGQQVVAEERVFIPLLPEVVKEELKKLD